MADPWVAVGAPVRPPPAPTPKLGNIQALRAIAVLMVVVGHVSGPNGFERRFLSGEPLLGWAYLPIQTAIDLFFIITGLILTITTWKDDRGAGTARSFLVRRAKRIYPPYWVPTFLIMLLFLTRPELVNASSAYPPEFLQSFLLLPQAGLPFVAVGWTLVFDVYFYVVFAAALLVRRAWMPWILGLWGAVTLVLALAFGSSTVPTLQVIANPMCLEFLLGVGIGYLVMTRPPIAPALLLGVGIILLVIGIGFASRIDATWLQPWYRALVIGPPAALIVLGAIGLERQHRLVAPRLLQYLGDASYSIYLWHVLVLVVAGRVLAWLLPDTGGLHVALLITAPIVAVIVSVVLYELIERKLMRVLSRRPVPKPREAAS